MKGSLKKLALTCFMLALMAGNAAAFQCALVVHVKLPPEWGSSLYINVDGTFYTVSNSSKSGDWTTFNISSYGSEYANNFFISSSNSNWDAPAIGKVEWNVKIDQNTGKILCSDAKGGSDLYISQNPTNPSRTVVNNVPPNAKYFYFLPPNEENWIIGTPYYVYGEGSNPTKIKMDPDERCGWFKLTYFSDSPPDAPGWIQLGAEYKSEDDILGVLGVNEDVSEWVGGKPKPFNLAEQFGSGEGEMHLSFFAGNEINTWKPSAPTASDEDMNRCTYKFAAIIYDTDKSVNPSFTLVTDDVGTGSDQYGQWTSGIIKGMVKSTLNDERKIECENCARGGTLTSSQGYFLTKQDFEDAFKPTPGKNVTVCYDMPFERQPNGLWEFDSDKMLNDNGRPVGGFFPKLLQNRVLAVEAGADYDQCPSCDAKYKAESFVNLTNKINPWCFERGLKSTTNLTGTTLAACGTAYGPGDFAHGGAPADTWGATPTGGAEWQNAWRYNQINLWGTPNGENAQANPFFCFESHAEFTYEKGQEFFFRGDDDIWVYIANNLAIDLGGSHLAAPGYVKLDDAKDAKGNNLKEGEKYPIDIFFCDRRTTMSNVRISTNMYFSQSTGLSVDGNANNIDAPICLAKNGGGGCAAQAGNGEGSSSLKCGSELDSKLLFYMQRRSGDSTGLTLSPNNPQCSDIGNNKLRCFGRITIDFNNNTVRYDKDLPLQGGLSGRYFIYVAAPEEATPPPPRLVTSFTLQSYIFAVWGDIKREDGRAIANLPPALKNVRNGEQSTIAGKRVPIAFADGGWEGPNIFSVSDASEGSSVTISRNGLDNEDGTSELKIYREETGGEPLSLGTAFEIPESGVLVLWVTGNYEASDEFEYNINVQGATENPHKVKVRLPYLDYVTEGSTTRIPKSDAFGSDPSRGTTPEARAVYMGIGLDRYIAAFDPADNSLCATCDFPITVEAWVTDANDGKITGPTGAGVLRADKADIVGGKGELSFRGVVETGPNSNPNYPYALLSVRGPSTKEGTQALWKKMIFTKPPVPTPQHTEIFDDDGDGKGDRIRITYDRPFRGGARDTMPNKIEVIWDPNRKDTLRFGLGKWSNDEKGFNNDGIDRAENTRYWTGEIQDSLGAKISMENDDSTIVISGVNFSDNVKTSVGKGNVVVRNWATYMGDRGAKVTSSFESDISDKIPAIVFTAIFNGADCNRDTGPCDDQVVITLSEPVKAVDGVNYDRTGNMPSLAVPFQYKLVAHTPVRDNWDTYSNDADLPVGNTRWRPSTSTQKPDGQRDSIVTIAYRYMGSSSNTPLRNDSVKFASGGDAAFMDLEGNLPNPNEWGRKFVGEISISTGKVPIGEVDPNNTMEDVRNTIKDRNNSGSGTGIVISDTLFGGNKIAELLPLKDGWNADSIRIYYPGTIGVMFRPDVVSKGVNPEDVTFHASAFYHTNLGNYVVDTPKRSLTCNDPIFKIHGAGTCMDGNGMGVYLAWNMKDAKNRWVGAGAYVEVYDFYWEIKSIDGSNKDKNGTYDKMSKKIEMLGVKRAKIKR